MSNIANKISTVLANTYALYLKTQNYHWHVSGPQFQTLHLLFESQYEDLAKAVDEVAERLRILGHKAPATFQEFINLTKIKDGDSEYNSEQMIEDLTNDHKILIKDLHETINISQESNDDGTIDLCTRRIAAHEKAHWMLRASLSS